MTIVNSGNGGQKKCKGKECLFPDVELMKRFKSARFKGQVNGATFEIESISPACGDKVCFSGKIDQGKVVEVKFEGQGSMLSQVFADALCEFATGRTVDQLKGLSEEDIRSILQVEVGPTRFQTLLFVAGVLKQGLTGSC